MFKAITMASALALTAGAATAGGFERSGLPIGFMFEKGTYGELTFGHVSPKIKGAAGGGLAPTGNVGVNYSQVGLSFKMDLNDKVSLGLALDPTFGADISYPGVGPGPGAYPIRGTHATLNGDTIALIGRYKINENVSVHAGLRSVSVGGNVTVANGGAPVYNANYATDRDVGYLIGAAYEKPEIAMRIALTYQSATKHTLATTVFGAAVPAALYPQVELPQSVTLDFQSGVAANTLVFGSIRWAEWKATKLISPLYPLNPLVSYANNTVTYNIGIGRKFNEQWSGAVSIGVEKAHGGLASNLSPTDGYRSIQVGATYTMDKVKISGGIRYVDIGGANALESPPGSGISNAQFKDNSAVALGLKIAYTF